MSASLRGKTIAFSGPFAMNSGRREAIAKALKAGATISPVITKDIDLVFKGDAKVSKPTVNEIRAKNQGLKVLGASSFLKFVQAGGADRINKVVTAMRAPVLAVAPAAASTKGRVRSIASPSAAKKMKASTTAALPVTLIESEEKEAANFGPMPWMKGSKFNRRKELAAKRKRTLALQAKLAAKAAEEAKRVAAAAPPTTTTEVVAAAASSSAVAPAISAPQTETATISTDSATNTITFTPSKGLSVQFTGNFEDFLRVATQLADPKAAAASVLDEAKPAPKAATGTAPVVAAAVVVASPSPAAAVVAAVEAAAEKAPEVIAETKKEEAATATKKTAAGIAFKKVAGRARRVVTTKTAAAAAPEPVKLKRKVISFTGTFYQMKRLGLQTLAAKAGAFLGTGINKDVDLVVVGADAPHKKLQAQKLGIPVVNEKTFLASCRK